MVRRHYRGEAQREVYYRIPKMLFENPRYESMSTLAKVLYGLMLDRMGLSATRERWMDKDGSVYIYFQQTEAMKLLKVKGAEKIVKLYKELEEAELIERVKQGFGKPEKIYVGYVDIYDGDSKTAEDAQSFENRNSAFSDLARLSKIESKTFENRKYGLSKIESIPNKTESETNQINQSISRGTSETDKTPSESAVAPSQEDTETQVAAQIDKQGLYKQYPQNKGTIDAIAGIMADELTSDRATGKIGGANRARADIRARLLAVTAADVTDIIDAMREHPPKMTNPRGYLLTCLYNAPAIRMSREEKKGKKKNEESELWKYAEQLRRKREKKKAAEAAKKDYVGDFMKECETTKAAAQRLKEQ